MQDAYRVLKPFQSVIDGLLHETCNHSLADRQRHGIFIGVHLIVGLLALASLPLCLLLAYGQQDGGMASLSLLPLWMIAPLVSVAYLSQTGRLSNAFLLTAGLTAAFVIWVASMTGGFQSPHLIWLGVIPLEVALSGNNRIIKHSLFLCFGALGFLAALEFGDFVELTTVQGVESKLIASLSLMAAIFYAGLLAIRIEWNNRHRLGEVEAEEMRYRSLANNASDMITRHDRSGDVTFASPAARFLFDTQPDQLLRNGLFHHIHIQDRPSYLQALSRCMNREDGSCQPIAVELRILSAANGDVFNGQNGNMPASVRWVEMKCAPEFDEDGKIVGAITITRDISRRMQQHVALEKARKEAEDANESKIRFLANVTHELRTPLNTIIGFSEILCHPELLRDSEERNREYAELIHKGGHHLLHLVNALLDMSRIESGNFEVNPQQFDMCDLTQSCCKMMQAEADQRGITLFSECEPDLIESQLDPRACRQILLNLISNALKFSDEGDKVRVGLGLMQTGKDEQSGGKLLLTISDTGIGIDKEDIPKLGKPFVQAESGLQRRYEGAGIGLSIVRGLAELQHGSMKIESKLGVGTTVTVMLPVDMLAKQPESQSDDLGDARKDVISLNAAENSARTSDQEKKKTASGHKVA